MTTFTLALENAAVEDGERTAGTDADEKRYTYVQLDAAASHIALLLRDDGCVAPGDIGAIFPKRFWTATYMYGVLELGAVATIENPTLPTDVHPPESEDGRDDGPRRRRRAVRRR